MRTVGVYLILVAVALRGIVKFIEEPYFPTILGLLATYGFLLFMETWIRDRRPSGLFQHRTSRMVYVLLQSAVVIALLISSTYEDFFALLFIPLCLDVVSSFGRRFGSLCILVFSLALTVTLSFSDDGQLQGLAMGGLYSGLCFLFGGYASQVLKAEAAHDQNQRTFHQLQIAHHQLQGYANQVASLAVEHERNRLARDLHDSVTQTVFSMNLTAQSARLLLKQTPPRVSELLLHLEELAANALSEIQSLVSQLKPHSIVEEGLPTALHRLAWEHQSRDGLQVSLELYGEKNLSEAEALGLYSITHEALTNIIKHSGGLEATVRLRFDEAEACLQIEDHGVGFNPQAVSDRYGHLGLTGMSERAQEIGWRFCVESQRGQGTRIFVSMQKQPGVSK